MRSTDSTAKLLKIWYTTNHTFSCALFFTLLLFLLLLVLLIQFNLICLICNNISEYIDFYLKVSELFDC